MGFMRSRRTMIRLKQKLWKNLPPETATKTLPQFGPDQVDLPCDLSRLAKMEKLNALAGEIPHRLQRGTQGGVRRFWIDIVNFN
jgi:hypothetical protein